MFDVEKFNPTKLNKLEVRKEYQINALNPICHPLALLETLDVFHVNRIRFKSQTGLQLWRT